MAHQYRAKAQVATASRNGSGRLGDSWSWVEIATRCAFGYGMFVVRGMAELRRARTRFALRSAPPPADAWPQLGRLWRESEIAWELAPYADALVREHVECRGAFPSARCACYRSDAATPRRVEGAWTDHLVARAVGDAWNAADATSAPLRVETWEQLAAATRPRGGAGPRYGEDWTWPRSLEPPRPDDHRRAVAIEVIRTPAGSRVVRALGARARFVPTRAPAPSGHTVSSRRLVWAADARGEHTFDPYQVFHTFTIAWAPKRIAFYVDAPDKGTAVERAEPISVFAARDYPTIGALGPQYPGGELEWRSQGAPRKLGEVSISIGVRPEPDRVRAALAQDRVSAFVQSVAFYPLRPGVTGASGLTSRDFSTGRSDPTVLRADFALWPEATSHARLAELFAIEVRGAPVPLADLARCVRTGPDGNPALELRAIRHARAPRDETEGFYDAKP